jgi:fatty acid desaturase
VLPGPELLPDVLPTDRLTAGGRPVPEVRAALRDIPDAANVVTVLGCWAQIGLPVWVAVRIDHPVVWFAAFLVAGRNFARLSILAHEAAHRLLFSNRRMNDAVGRWLLAYPAFVPLDVYRRGHLAHHGDELGPDEPDLGLYAGYPVSRGSLRRKLWRDARGTSGWKNLRPLLGALRSSSARPVALRILIAQAVLLGLCAAIGRPELYLFLWLLPWLTVWRVLNRLRSIAEHGGMIRSPDRRLTTHHVRQRPLARFWIVPYNTGWHLAHHVDIGVPWRKLPALHRELVAAGWVVPGLEHRSYIELWSVLASGPIDQTRRGSRSPRVRTVPDASTTT